MTSLKRISIIVCTLCLVFTMLALPAAATSTENVMDSYWYSISGSYVSNTGTNSVSSARNMYNYFYGLPDNLRVFGFDCLLYSSAPLDSFQFRYSNSYVNASLYDLGQGYYRAILSEECHSNIFGFRAYTSAAGTAAVLSFNVLTTSAFYFTDDGASLDVTLNGEQLAYVTQSSGYDSIGYQFAITSTPGDSGFTGSNDMLPYNVNIQFFNAPKYDQIQFLIRYRIDSLDSITVTYNDVAVPFEITHLTQEMETLYKYDSDTNDLWSNELTDGVLLSVSYLVGTGYITVDLTDIDRTVEGYLSVNISGKVSDHTDLDVLGYYRYFYLDQTTCFIKTNFIDHMAMIVSNGFSAVNSAFSSVFQYFDDLFQRLDTHFSDLFSKLDELFTPNDEEQTAIDNATNTLDDMSSLENSIDVPDYSDVDLPGMTEIVNNNGHFGDLFLTIIYNPYIYSITVFSLFCSIISLILWGKKS